MKTLLSLLFTIASVVAVNGQSGTTLPNPKTTPKPETKKPKLPPPAEKLFVPDLRLRGSESVDSNATVPKSYRKVIFIFENWNQFPAETLQPSSSPPSLPPAPCKQVKVTGRLFGVLHAKNGEVLGCTELAPQQDFYFLFEKTLKLPAFVYVDVVDRTKGMIFRSSQVSPSTGALK